MITVDILGPTVVTWDGHVVTLSAVNSVITLILAVTPGNALPSDELQHKAWPDRESDDKAAARLRRVVLDLRARFASALPETPPRTACPPHRALIAGRPGYQLPAVRTDAAMFADMATRSRVSFQRGDHWGAWRQAGDALKLWRGMPLTDAYDRSFALEHIRRIEQARLAAETVRCVAGLILGMHRELLPTLEHLAASVVADRLGRMLQPVTASTWTGAGWRTCCGGIPARCCHRRARPCAGAATRWCDPRLRPHGKWW
jgi:hypothetical protein